MTETSDVINPYAYLEKDGFTSEIFKIEIKNLDPRISFTQLKKRLINLNVNPHKMKILKNVTFVTFKTTEERDKALAAVNGHEWKNRILFAKIAAARVDPFLLKRKEAAEADENEDSKKPKIEDSRTDDEKLKDHIVKFWRKSYAEQLVEKEAKIKTILVNVCNKLQKEDINFKAQSKYIQKVGNDELACQMLPIVKSPIERNYRNKAEFTFGMTLDGSGPITGFCHGKYRGGVNAVGDSSKIDILSPQMYPVLASSNRFLQKLSSFDCAGVKIDIYQPGVDTGHLRGLTLRTGIDNELLISMDVHPQQLTEDQIVRLGQFIREHFTNDAAAEQDLNLSGILMSVRKNNSDPFDRTTTRILYGSEFIHEVLINDLKFRISFNAFFQVNTPAANVLYSTIRDVLKNNILTNENVKVTLLDVCCGTGTIGLVMADLVDRVVGVDIVEESIENAKYNAELNVIPNAEFVAGKAEDVMDKLIETEEARITKEKTDEPESQSREFVAIVDPPRGGLHNDVIRAIRRCSLIKKIIYVSCNPEAASTNFQSLCRPISKRTHGAPFTPELAIPVDLFPQTPHVELVILLSR